MDSTPGSTDETNYAFIVGAPRSGTKLLRDTIGKLPQVETSTHPLEEIWSLGQEDAETDQYDPRTLTPEIKKQIRENFKDQHEACSWFIEKNVFHSLRIPYIREIFPRARFIHILRNPRDVAVSLRDYRQSPVDWKYYLSGGIFQLSAAEIVHYSGVFIARMARRLFQGKQQVTDMGPIFPGYYKLLQRDEPLEMAVSQWRYCVESIHESFRSLPKSDSIEIHYRTLIEDYESELDRLGMFLKVASITPMLRFAEKNYRTNRLDRWREDLEPDEIDTLNNLLTEKDCSRVI